MSNVVTVSWKELVNLGVLHDKHLLDDGLQKGLIRFRADNGFVILGQLGESLADKE